METLNQEQTQETQSQEIPELKSLPDVLSEGAKDPEVKPLEQKLVKDKTSVSVSAEKQLEMPSYTPNFKFKANRKEYEIPEFLRAAIKDAKSEEHVRSIYSKAYGIDSIQERLQATRQEHAQMSQAYTGVMSQITEAHEAYKKGDLDTVFETFKIKPEKVLQWAVERVQLSQLPPEQRKAYEDRKQAERQAGMMEKQLHQTSQEHLQQQAQHLGQMLDLILERPDYTEIAQNYDTKRNQPGAFRDLVILVGEHETARTGKILAPMDAAKKAMELLGEGVSKQPATPAATGQAQPQATPAESPKQDVKKTLPNLSNAGARTNASPGKAKVKSIDDLKRKYDEISAQQ